MRLLAGFFFTGPSGSPMPAAALAGRFLGLEAEGDLGLAKPANLALLERPAALLGVLAGTPAFFGGGVALPGTPAFFGGGGALPASPAFLGGGGALPRAADFLAAAPAFLGGGETPVKLAGGCGTALMLGESELPPDFPTGDRAPASGMLSQVNQQFAGGWQG